MAKVDYKTTSPWAETVQSTWYLGHYTHRPIGVDGSDEKIIVDRKYHERPDLLSHALYGTTDYWWVFMVRNPNKIKDPIHDLQGGMTIMVPTRERLEERLL